MEKTNGLRDALSKTFADRRNWNRRIEVAGEHYIYCSAKNEIRRIDQREGYEVALLVGCFVLGKFVWCC